MFQDYFVRIKVRLNTDLNRYMNGLSCGLEGYTLGNVYKENTYEPVINVYFEKINMVASITLDNLDIIDKDYLAFLTKREKECLNEFSEATNIVKYVGPRGGFKRLTLTLKNEKMNFNNRTEASKIEKILLKFNKSIEEKII